MALVFEAPDDGGARTHALVIGVGGYDHLVGGQDPKVQIIPQIGILRQLTTAPRSAVAFAEFLIKLETGPEAEWIQPLGSVELLISTGPDDTDFTLPNGFNPGNAIFESIQEAYDRWLPLHAEPAPLVTHRVGLVIHERMEPELEDNVAALIEQLGSDDAATREAAFQKLMSIGGAAFPQIEEAASGQDRQIAFRCRSILEALDAAPLAEADEEQE